jgi:uncharacterized membrane protein
MEEPAMTKANEAPPILPDHVEETIRSIKRLHAEHHVRATPQQRAVARVTSLISRPLFVAILVVAIGGWIVVNALAAAFAHSAIDPPPFQWLQGTMTFVSLLMVVFILGAQRHEDELNNHRELLTLELAILSEQKTAKVIQLLEEFRRDSPELHDRVDHEANAMAQPSDPQTVLDAIKGNDRGGSRQETAQSADAGAQSPPPA